VDIYQPTFYVLPQDEYTGVALFQVLFQQSTVKKLEWQDKFTDLFEYVTRGMKRLICAYPESILHYKPLAKKLEHDPRVSQLFNTDLSHIQQYLFTKLKIEPTSKVEVEYDKNDSRLIKINKITEKDIVTPPFSILYFEIHTASSSSSYDSGLDQIREISVRYQQDLETSFEGSEENILIEFCRYILTKDPDILIGSSNPFEHKNILFDRINMLGLDMPLGRDEDSNSRTNRINGRVYLDNNSVQKDLDFVGLIEKARFSFLPLGQASRYGINRLVDSRNCYELIQRGFVIPRSYQYQHDKIRTVEEIITKDKGGMIFSPQIGVHENVVVLDYENEYANLILRHNLSYETGKETTIHKEKGLLPIIIEKVLDRRMLFKNLQKKFVTNTNEWHLCEQRIGALKSILVCLYGTTGSFWNRLANVMAFEEINRLSREVLIKTKDIVQAHGFELIYADTDSVFLKKNGASLKDFECGKDALTRETGLPMSLEHHYKFLVLLPLEADQRMEALKHYFGITHDGELIARGIEIRRHDSPNFIKEFQSELLKTLFDCNDLAEVYSKGYDSSLLLVTRIIDKVMSGEIEVQDLVVSKLLRQDINKYSTLFPHVSAAIQLRKAGKSLVHRENIQFVYTDAQHKNPLCRVTPLGLIKQGEEQEKKYDKEKYRDMLLEAAETVLGYFGFDRTAFGDTVKKRNRKWWYALSEERNREIENEKM
jgi:DNA polymerase elongation subunit (family B)